MHAILRKHLKEMFHRCVLHDYKCVLDDYVTFIQCIMTGKILNYTILCYPHRNI